MRVVDLFCGAGGFSEGFERAGFKIIKAYDIWGPAILTHNQNHGFGENPAYKGDIYELSMLPDEEFEDKIPDSEIIIGSPPCVAFSNSNKSGKANKDDGIRLIKAYLRIVARKLAKPNSILQYWVMENVVNSSKYLLESYTAEDLEWPELGDFVLRIPRGSIYNMKNFGVPTNRKRYICGDFPEIMLLNDDENVIKLKDVLNSLGSPNPEDYTQDSRVIQDPIYGITLESREITDHHYIKEIPDFEWKKAKRQKLDKGYMGRMSFPENKDKPARTIMATLSASSRESMIFQLDESQERYRYPTIREAATIMSFPIDFRFYGESDTTKYRMIGNAVTPKFSYEIAKCIREDMLKNNPDLEIEDRFNNIKIFNDNEFTNLNGAEFALKIEKVKNEESKYSYHVPYLILKAYRVGLNNKIINNNIVWEVKIHHSQGKNAKVYENLTKKSEYFSEIEYVEMYNFINKYISLIGSYGNLQENYCKATNQRINLIGPDELLNRVKEFILIYKEREIYVEEIGTKLSSHIIMSYFVLNQIIEGLMEL